MATHLKIRNMADGGKWGGVIWRHKILDINLEVITCNKINVDQLSRSYVGMKKWDSLGYETKKSIYHFQRATKIGTFKN